MADAEQDGCNGRDPDWERPIPFDPRLAYSMPTAPTVRVRGRIEPEAEKSDAGLTTHDRRYQALAKPLGAAAGVGEIAVYPLETQQADSTQTCRRG